MKVRILVVPIFWGIKRKAAVKGKRILQRLRQKKSINNIGIEVKLCSENEELKAINNYAKIGIIMKKVSYLW